MMLSNPDCRYSDVTPSTPATAFRRSTSKPMIVPLGSLYSLGLYVWSVPTINFPDCLMLSGNRFAIWSTLVGFTAVAHPLGPEPSVLLVQPHIASAAEMTTAPGIINPRDVLIPSFFLPSGRRRAD